MCKEQQEMAREEKNHSIYYTERDNHWFRKTQFAGGKDSF